MGKVSDSGALVELTIERGDDSSRERVLSIHDIADKFAELYWRQATPFQADRSSGRGLVLHQNHRTQAGAVSRLVEFHNRLLGATPASGLKFTAADRLALSSPATTSADVVP